VNVELKGGGVRDICHRFHFHDHSMKRRGNRPWGLGGVPLEKFKHTAAELPIGVRRKFDGGHNVLLLTRMGFTTYLCITAPAE
jgi:hypothetical protein